jgi:Rhodopirellula transposase DDE domain
MDISLQGNRKTREGKQHPDRDAQFEHINARVKARKRRGDPALSVDTKKKEKLGNMSNGGLEYEPKSQPRETETHDFLDKAKGKAVPYGVYDIHRNEAVVSVARLNRAWGQIRDSGLSRSRLCLGPGIYRERAASELADDQEQRCN